jgi:alpha-aminoadipic semialdehyde synthase
MMITRPKAKSAALARALLSTSSSSAVPLTVGIRREDPSRIWERRCPLTPEAVYKLVRSDGVRVLVQDCERRIFPIEDFIAVSSRASTCFFKVKLKRRVLNL